MKVLTLSQPNALLVVHGYQTIIVRESDTDHRGLTAIYASREWGKSSRVMLDIWPANEAMIEINNRRIVAGMKPFMRTDIGFPSTMFAMPMLGEEIAESVPVGAIVGVAYLAKTEKTHGITERWNRKETEPRLERPSYNDVPRFENVFSDMTNGKTAYWMMHPIALAIPINVEGWPGLWDTRHAAERDSKPDAEVDFYEDTIHIDLASQGLFLPNTNDPAFWREIQRRGECGPTTPRNP